MLDAPAEAYGSAAREVPWLPSGAIVSITVAVVTAIGAVVAVSATLGLRKMDCSRRKLEYDALLDAEFEHDPGERVRVVGGEQE